MPTFFLILGCILFVLMFLAIVFYYAKKRKQHVEEPKYRIFQDDFENEDK